MDKIDMTFKYNGKDYIVCEGGTGYSADGLKKMDKASMATILNKAIDEADKETAKLEAQATSFSDKAKKLKEHKG